MKYHWENNEANFGPPIKDEVPNGSHITFEIILKKDGKYLALRRSKGISGHKPPTKKPKDKNGFLYFCHDLIRYGESSEECIERILESQAKIRPEKIKLVYLDSHIQDNDGQWSVCPHFIVEISSLPKITEEISEVVTFLKDDIPEDFAWWEKEELKEFLEEFDN